MAVGIKEEEYTEQVIRDKLEMHATPSKIQMG